MKITRKQFSAFLHVLEKEESRYSIYGLYVDEAEDGKGILVCTSTTGLVILEKLDNPGDLKGKILAAPKARLLKNDKGINIVKKGKEYYYSFIGKDGKSRILEEITFLEKSFPNYKVILEGIEKPEFVVCLNPTKIPQAFEKVEFRFSSSLTPIECIPFDDPESKNIRYVIMPQRKV